MCSFPTPDWSAEFDSIDDEECEADVDDMLSGSIETSCDDVSTLCSLEKFSEDVSANILCHFSLSELAAVGRVSTRMYRASRSPRLWKTLFQQRWNVNDANEGRADYFMMYQQAHLHPHDLWVTHVNCIFPADGLTAGLCQCHLSPKTPAGAKRKDFLFSGACSELLYCPTCRNWDRFANMELPSESRHSKAESLALHSRSLLQSREALGSHHLSMKQCAKHAIETASTFHRRIRTTQYEPVPTNFLTDLVFFSLFDPCSRNGQWELEQLLTEVNAPVLDPEHETAQHSWHIIRLANPDLSRPLVYQVGLQRPDCFTVFPAEGYIEPGGFLLMTIGVRPLGSALAYAFEALNTQRDATDARWADLYAAEAHLPMAPVLIRYKWAVRPPESPTEDNSDPHRDRRHDFATASHADNHAILDYHWKQEAPAYQIRSVHLSAHVNAHYTFAAFQQRTCRPWNILQGFDCIFAAPALRECYPTVFSRLENLPMGQVQRFKAQTSGPCFSCKQKWGIRDEEQLHSYFVQHVRNLRHESGRCTLLCNIQKCLDVLENTVADSTKTALLCVTIHNVLQSMKAMRWLSVSQHQGVRTYETLVDQICCQIPIGGATWSPWRMSGVYQHLLSTDSVFCDVLLPNVAGDEDITLKDEPHYLDAFRHLAHTPGRLCVGPQEDPNHLGETSLNGTGRYFRRQLGPTTDIFMDDPILAMQAGICMVKDPRSLLVHGIYDRIPYPGSIVRSPRILTARHGTSEVVILDQLARAFRRASYFRLQDFLALPSALQRSPFGTSDSMDRYLNNVPSLGEGRFAVSGICIEPDIRGLDSIQIRPLDFDEGQDEGGIPGLDKTTSVARQVEETAHVARLAVGGPPPGRGPRIFHLLWLLGAQMGLAVIDSPHAASVFVDRNILIASQWVSISLTAAPLFWTLCARYAQLIPAQPIDYNLEDLPFAIQSKMRFLSESECGGVALLVLGVWLVLARWTERHTSRDLFRVMLDHMHPVDRKIKSPSQRIRARGKRWLERRWDDLCPLFLQRRSFSPEWNRRSKEDLLRHMAFWRNLNLSEHVSVAQAGIGRSKVVYGNDRDTDLDLGMETSTKGVKVIVGVLAALGSFCSSSPLFWLNVITVFSCSISLGMSVSLHSMEKGRPPFGPQASLGSMLMSTSLITVAILAFLVGQLIGSSGGAMFLAEFVVTSVSLLLGGAGTISASAMESWGCFFCLCCASFFGYLFGRVALMDGVRNKYGGFSSMLLSSAVIFLFLFWVFVFIVLRWDTPVSLIVWRPRYSNYATVWAVQHEQILAKLQ